MRYVLFARCVYSTYGSRLSVCVRFTRRFWVTDHLGDSHLGIRHLDNTGRPSERRTWDVWRRRLGDALQFARPTTLPSGLEAYPL